MADTNYDDLKGEFSEIKKDIYSKKSNFREDIRDLLKGRGGDTKDGVPIHKLDQYAVVALKEVNDYASKGDFKATIKTAQQFENSMRYNKSRYIPTDVPGSVLIEPREENYQKYFDSMIKRLDRGSNRAIKYLKENKETVTRKKMDEIEELLDYSAKFKEKHGRKGAGSSGLEKAVTAISLLSIILGVAIGYPSLTGNVIAETIPGSFKHGALLFLIGLTGVFVANKK